MTGRRIAANPIPYWSRAGKTREVFDTAFRDFQAIGFTAVKADVPTGMSADQYREWIGSYGLSPSLSLFNSPFDETVDPAAEIERAKRFAATQVALGLDRTMISSMSLPARMARPGVGAGFEPGRLDRAIDACGTVCRVLQVEGLRPLHHSHVGGVFETEYEIVRLLSDLGPDVIGFGPDTGHLRWAGIDPAPFIARFADRMGGIHIKDCFPDLLDPADRESTERAPARRARRSRSSREDQESASSARMVPHDRAGAQRRPVMSYHETQATKRLWAEPGLGTIDFTAVMAAVPAGYDGDFMIEVDEPSVASRYESHRISFEWARHNLPASGG